MKRWRKSSVRGSRVSLGIRWNLLAESISPAAPRTWRWGWGLGRGMEPDVVTEGVNGGNSGELTVGKVEPDSHPVAQRLDGDVEKEIEEFTSFPEDPAEGFRDGENELAVRDVETDAG